MELRNEIAVEAPAEATWEILGERFHRIGDWAAPIVSSCPVGSDAPGVGAIRACHIARVGLVKPGTVKERLLSFDRALMTFEYEAFEGLPSFITRAANRWSVHQVDDLRCLVRVHATLTLQGPMVLLSCPIEWQMQAVGARAAEELKYYVERGRPHPRKLTTAANVRS
jgi:hypothetical protein